jgi:hypothetical protein
VGGKKSGQVSTCRIGQFPCEIHRPKSTVTAVAALRLANSLSTVSYRQFEKDYETEEEAQRRVVEPLMNE